jgi:plasmid stabilization system protein ParE
MPRGTWSAKRERQYEHIKESESRRGESPQRAEEIAARTVNKQRTRTGEARRATRGRRTR